MEDLIKGEPDWHNKVNENFHEVDSQMADNTQQTTQYFIEHPDKLLAGNIINTQGFYNNSEQFYGKYIVQPISGNEGMPIPISYNSFTFQLFPDLSIKVNDALKLIPKLQKPNEIPINILGAVADGAFNNTPIYTTIINYLNNNTLGGKMILPKGIIVGNFIFEAYETSANNRHRMKIIGAGMDSTLIRGYYNAPIFQFNGNYLEGTRQQIESVQIEDIAISGASQNKIGLEMNTVQYIHMRNVWIRDCLGGAIKFTDAWDCHFENIHISNCGHITSNDDYAPALNFLGVNDNTNACKFTNCRLEALPIFIYGNNVCRHNYFVNCKFEKASPNYYDIRPFHFLDILEFGFDSCMFVNSEQNSGGSGVIDGGKPFFTVTNDIPAYAINSNILKSLLISNCHFDTPSNVSSCWLNINFTRIANCVFNSCEGGTDTHRNAIGVQNVIEADFGVINGCSLFAINNQFNKIYARIALNTELGSVIALNAGASNNDIEISIVSGNYQNILLLDNSFFIEGYNYLGSNKFRQKFVAIPTTSSTVPSLSLGCDTVINSQMSNIIYIKNGYNTQKITLITTVSVTIVHNPSLIILKNGINETLAAGQAINLVNVNGVWYEY